MATRMTSLDPQQVASAATYSSAWAGVASWFAGVDWLPIIGCGVVVCTFFVNWYYNRSKKQFAAAENRRKQERHELEMAKLRRSMRGNSRASDLS